MSLIADESYIGKGNIFLAPYSGTGALRPLGNCSALSINKTKDEKSLLDFTDAGGGKANILERISAVNFNFTAHDLSADNAALLTRGIKSAVTSGAVTDEQHTAYQGGLVLFDNIPDLTQTITIEVGATAMDEGDDYIVTPGGIMVLTGGAINNGDTVLCTYTKKAGNKVEALTGAATNYKLVFVGLNEAQSGREVTIEVHKYKPGVAETIDLIGDDYGSYNVTGEALKDSAITGAGLSKFYTVKMAN